MWRFRRRSRDRRTKSRDRKTSRERRSRSRKRSPTPPPTVRPPFRRATRSPLGLRGQSPIEELSSEERDARTVFCMQLSQRIRARDLEEFFSSVGKVRDVRMIVCNKTRRFKGIAYIEFKDPESVALVNLFRMVFIVRLVDNCVISRLWVCPVRSCWACRLSCSTRKLRKTGWATRCPTCCQKGWRDRWGFMLVRYTLTSQRKCWEAFLSRSVKLKTSNWLWTQRRADLKDTDL